MGTAYSGWMLSEESRALLLSLFMPRFPEVKAHHVTHSVGVRHIPDPVEAYAVGIAADRNGIEALVVEINGTTERHDGKVNHITWSLDRDAGFKPHHSNRLIAEQGWETLGSPMGDGLQIEIKLIPFYRDENGRDFFTLSDEGPSPQSA